MQSDPVTWSEETLGGLGLALNEATLIGVEVDVPGRTVGVTLAVLSLPESGPQTNDNRVLLRLSPVGRIAASLRRGRWFETESEVDRFTIRELFEVVSSFGGTDIYGWEFFDCGTDVFERWSDRPSLDWRSGVDGLSHTLDLFQEGGDQGQRRHLDLRIWFNGVSILSPNGSEISVPDFIAGGKRWWDAFNHGDKRTTTSGLFPLAWDQPKDAQLE